MSTEKIKRTIGAWILVRQDKAEEKTSSGIIVPQTTQTPPPQGTVVHAGPESTFKAGSRIVFGANRGYEIHIEEEDLRLITEDDAIFELEPAKV